MVIEKSINKKSLYRIYKIIYLLIIFSIFIIPAFAAGTPSKIEVSVNRYAVWTPYQNDQGTTGSTFTAYALVMDSNGTPVSGQSVTFKIYSAASSGTTLVSTQTATTAANGIASISYDVSNVITSSTDADAGSWKIDSYPTSYPGVISSTNGWYSARTSSGCYSLCHKSNTGNDGDDPKSPYNDRFGQTNTKSEAAHTKNNHQSKPCTNCHVGYDAGTGTIHNTQTCINCHGNYPSDGIPLMPGCYDCHPNQNNKLFSLNTLGTVSGFTGVSIFSWDRYAPEVAHTSSGNSLTQGIPCVSCHGPAHNITKPVLSGTSNSYTEDSQCANCHVSKGKHSNGNPVYCTACHSQDAHAIGVINKNSGTQPAFVSLGTTNAMTKDDCVQCHASGPESTYFASLTGMSGYGYTTNYVAANPVHNNHNGTVACTVCHDNADFHTIKFLQPDGVYSSSKTTAVKCVDCHDGTNSAVRSVVQTRFGSLPPTVNANMNHSSDNSGQKWGNYWTTPNDACLYCHGETQHNTSAIGAAGSALGTDKVGDPIGSGTVCSSCHNQDDTNYNVVNALTPKPPANKPGANYPSSGAVDHSSYGVTDNDCKSCHDANLAGGENMVGFTHNVAPGGGGGSCTGCHAQPPDGASRYNTQGAHALHSVAGYGDVPETSCNYCHSTEGVNEAGHPGSFNDASVAPNASVTITTYSQNTTSGKDDTCSGVSCHSKNLPSNAAAGVATWDNTTKGRCDVCHSTSATGMPATDDHLIHNVTKGYTCTNCHNGATHFSGGNANIGFSELANNSGYSTNWNQGTQTCTVYCHDPNGASYAGGDSFAVWTNTTDRTCTSCHGYPPVTTRNGVTHTTNTNCDGCHGTGATIGTQTGHINGVINTAGMTCTSCHAQPPSGISSPDTQGAHTLHASAGYGNVPETSCTYCHSNGGANDGGSHPNTVTNVSTNASATIAIYTKNPTGKDDTCGSVSCHNKSLPSNAVAGTATWDSTTQGRCDVCHSTSASGMPATDDHLIHNVTKGYTCTNCHYGATHFSGDNAEIGFSGLANNSGTYPTSWTQGTQTCVAYCHDPNGASYAGGDSFAVWTNTTDRTCTSCHGYPPVTTRNGVTHTTNTNCDGCHGTGATTGTQTGHINGVINTAGMTCTSCHAQPPSGISSPDTQGAHTLHASAGYGNVPETSCTYCHSNGGANDGGSHPNTVTNVSTNLSATIGTYTPNSGSGKNDKCASVSCHANGVVSVAANIGNATWDSTLLSCANCHSTLSTGLPPTGNHSKHYTTKGYQCATCHGTNADSGTQTGHKNNGLIDVSFTGLAAPGTFNSGTKTCSPYCHSPNDNDLKPDPTWGTTLGACGTNCHTKPPAITRSGSSIHAGLTGSSDCEGCHGTGANTGTQAGHVNGAIDGSGASCTGCHSNVGDASLGLHSNLNGTSAVEDNDCQTCHFGSFPMTTGAANSTNTYYCQACHTSSGTGPVKSTLLKDGLNHGSTDCKWCHAAGDQPDYKYHSNGPRGTATGQNCVTCHYYANLSALPFRAPGEIHSNNEAECNICHEGADNHYAPVLPGTPPTITQPTINGLSGTTSVTSGSPAYIQATVSDSMMIVSAAQYQITNGVVIVKDWTNMTGAFNSNNVLVSSTFDTTSLTGTYTVSVKGMASGPGSGPNYPLNGQWSSIASTQLIITESKGYINGTVRNNSVNISGAIVTTDTGVTAISDANGFYSFSLTNGTYQLTTVKEPEFYTNSSVSVTVSAPGTVTGDIILNRKPTGTISGKVTVK